MIKLQADTIRIRAEAGGELTLNLDQLRNELWQSCHLMGVEDPELADDIVAVIRNFVKEGPQSHQSYSRGEIDELVIQILLDSGFPQVATDYRRRRHLQEASGTVPDRVKPEPAIIRLILQRDPFFMSKPVDRVLDTIIRKIAGLQLSEVSPRLVMELGKEVWSENENQRKPIDADSYWLIHRDEIPSLLASPDARLIASGTVAVRSVSNLLPRLSIQANLDYLIGDSAVVVAELMLYPAFDLLCEQLHGMVDRLLVEIRSRATELAVIGDVGTHIQFGRSEEVARGQMQATGVAAARLRQDLDRIAVHHFPAGDGINFVID